jgi:serine/threonine protein kinase
MSVARTAVRSLKFGLLSSIKPKNQRHTVGANGDKAYGLSFQSEALGMPASRGYGWANLEFGQKIGDGGRYTIERKLGWGMQSSTWLARDGTDHNLVAVKVLTGHATELDRKNLVWESDALNAVSHQPISPHSIHLLSSFTMPGQGSTGDHFCFVTPIYAGDVNRLNIANHRRGFPLALAKRILFHLLTGLSHAHSRCVVHADLKMDNIFYNTSPVPDFERFLLQNPPRRHDPELSYEGAIIQSARSQPLPMISLDQALDATFVLGDYGCGM